MSRRAYFKPSIIVSGACILSLSSACAAVFSSPEITNDTAVLSNPETTNDAAISITKAPSASSASASQSAQNCVRVFYATSRQLSRNSIVSYSKARATEIDYGVCDVHVPDKKNAATSSHLQESSIEDASLENTKIVATRRFAGSQKLVEGIERAQASSNSTQLIIFVHGYACSFQKAVRIGSKLSHGTGLPVVIFAWPSRNNFLAYSADECNAEWSYPDFAQTLDLLSEKFGSQSITLVSHSMGARIITWTLREQDKRGPRYSHTFFSCPDIDQETFAHYSTSIAARSKDTKVFVSAKDIRLGVSELLHGASRMGRPAHRKNSLPVMTGIETVDFSALDRGIGHCIPYTLIFQAINREKQLHDIELITKEPSARTEGTLEVVKIARKHEHKAIVQ